MHRLHDVVYHGVSGKVAIARDRRRFFGYPLLTQEQVKLRTSNFVRIFIGSIRTKAHENFFGKVAVAVGVVRSPKNF